MDNSDNRQSSRPAAAFEEIIEVAPFYPHGTSDVQGAQLGPFDEPANLALRQLKPFGDLLDGEESIRF